MLHTATVLATAAVSVPSTMGHHMDKGTQTVKHKPIANVSVNMLASVNKMGYRVIGVFESYDADGTRWFPFESNVSRSEEHNAP